MARDIPFGLVSGMRLTDFSTPLEQAAPGMYRMPVPKPHPDFPGYLGLIAPVAGLQMIKAIGKELKTNSFGTSLRAAFDDFAARLSKVYGKGRLVDFVLDGALWSDPQDFMRSLEKGERTLTTVWDAQSGAAVERPLESVALGALAIDEDTGFLTLEYVLDREQEARREIESQQDDVL